MRDPKRIPLVIEKLREVWYKYPDMRFMQLVEFMKLKSPADDPFYLEDEEFLQVLEDDLNTQQ